MSKFQPSWLKNKNGKEGKRSSEGDKDTGGFELKRRILEALEIAKVTTIRAFR